MPLPQPAAWLFIAASSVIHFGYYVTLAQAYRSGDLSFAYPLMRGTAPLIVAVLGSIFLRELPSVPMMLGIALISLGVVSIAFVHGGSTRRARRGGPSPMPRSSPPIRWSMARARARRATPSRYVAWLIFLEGIPFLVWVFLRRGRPALAYLRASARTGLVGGACSLAAYGIVLWAMTRAPIAAVAALRETSVLFAALMGSLWLKEGFGWRRIAGAASVVAGIAALKLG